MTATERDAAAEETDANVRVTAVGGRLMLVGTALYRPLDLAEAERLAHELRRAVFDNAPEMLRVVGPVDDQADHDEVWSEEQAKAALAEGWEVAHGLRCPHERCNFTARAGDDDAVFVVDVDERWSRASYERDVEEDGTVAERVYTGGADSEFEGLGYRCVSCYGVVRLPDGVGEQWT